MIWPFCFAWSSGNRDHLRLHATTNNPSHVNLPEIRFDPSINLDQHSPCANIRSGQLSTCRTIFLPHPDQSFGDYSRFLHNPTSKLHDFSALSIGIQVVRNLHPDRAQHLLEARASPNVPRSFLANSVRRLSDAKTVHLGVSSCPWVSR